MAPKELALVLEVSKGCQLNCKGCNVNKDSEGLPSESELEQLQEMLLVLSMVGRDFAELEFGPTDMISAVNRTQILTHPIIASIARQFKVLVFNAAFVHADKDLYDQFAKEINDLSPLNVGLVVPLEITHVFNDKYVETIRKNIAYFRSKLESNFTEVIFNIIYDRNAINAMGTRFSYEELFTRARNIEVVENTAIDFAFHHARQGIDSPFILEELRQSILALNDYYLKDLSVRKSIEDRHIPSQILFEEEIDELVYSAGKLYVRPILNERIYVKDPMFQISRVEAGSADKWLQDITASNKAIASGTECQSCQHLDNCASRNVQRLMKFLQTEKCISILKDFQGLQ